MAVLTLTSDELCQVRCCIENALTEVALVATKLNQVGSKSNMEEGVELMAYNHILQELSFPSDFQDNTYPSLLSNQDIWRIYDRTKQIISQIKRNTN